MPAPHVIFFDAPQPTRAPLAGSIGWSAGRDAALTRHFRSGANLSAPAAPIAKSRTSPIARPSPHAPRPGSHRRSHASRISAPANRSAPPASLLALRAELAILALAPKRFARKPPSFARKTFRDKRRAKSLARKAPTPCARTCLACGQSKTTRAQSCGPCAPATKPCAPRISPQALSKPIAPRAAKPLRGTLNPRCGGHPCHHLPAAPHTCSAASPRRLWTAA